MLKQTYSEIIFLTEILEMQAFKSISTRLHVITSLMQNKSFTTLAILQEYHFHKES